MTVAPHVDGSGPSSPDGGVQSDGTGPDALADGPWLPPCTNPPSRIYTGPGRGSPTGIAVDSSNVYFIENVAGAVLSVPLCGGAVTTLASDNTGPWRTAVNATAVYWTSQGGTVKSVPLAGGAPTRLANAVMKVPLSGGVPVTVATSFEFPSPRSLTIAALRASARRAPARAPRVAQKVGVGSSNLAAPQCNHGRGYAE